MCVSKCVYVCEHIHKGTSAYSCASVYGNVHECSTLGVQKKAPAEVELQWFVGAEIEPRSSLRAVSCLTSVHFSSPYGELSNPSTAECLADGIQGHALVRSANPHVQE